MHGYSFCAPIPIRIANLMNFMQAVDTRMSIFLRAAQWLTQDAKSYPARASSRKKNPCIFLNFLQRGIVMEILILILNFRVIFVCC